MAHSQKALLASCAAGLAVLFSQAAFAEDIFQCTDASGRVEYKNTGETKGCKKLVIEPVVVPSTKVANNTPRGNPALFPSVDQATQKARDSDRRKILDDELSTQKTKMAQLQKDYNNGEPERTGDERNYQRYLDKVQQMKDNISRTQSDIDSIQGEIGKLPQ